MTKLTPDQRALMLAHSQASLDRDAKAMCAAAVELARLSKPTDVSLYVLRDSISREIIAAWPATGHRAPSDPTWLVNRYIQADPDLRSRRLRYRRERHQVSDLTSQILIACL